MPLSLRGRIRSTEEALAENERGQELDPRSPEVNSFYGISLYLAHRYDKAAEQLQKTLELEPEYWFARAYLGRAYRNLGRIQEAMAELRKATELSGGFAETWSGLAIAYAQQGKEAEARKILERLKVQSQPYVPPYSLATLYANLGEKEHALESLRDPL